MRHCLSNRILTLLLCGALIFLGSFPPSLAWADQKSTSDKLKEAEKAQTDTEKKLDETSDKISDLQDTKQDLQKSLNGLNAELNNVSDELAKIESQQIVKENEIASTEEEIRVAEEERDKQYKYIKARIRTVYERGKESYIELLLQTTNFGEFLNRAEYVARVNRYDQEVLNSFKLAAEEAKEKKAKLEQERAELKALQEDAKAEQEKVQQKVNSTRSSITAYAGEITEAEAEALAYEERLIAAKNTVSALREQLKKEEELARLSQQMKKRSLNEVSMSAGEKDLLAALIQCEAGGEPWAGKIAVGAVVMNRVMSGAFPNTITGVIYQPGQFEPVSSGRFAIVLSQGANSECYKAAERAMAGENNIGECLFFRTIVPGIKGTIIGHHVFYLYWTGKYSGYGTAEDSLADGPEAATGYNENSGNGGGEEENTEEVVEDQSGEESSNEEESNTEESSDSEEAKNEENSDSAADGNGESSSDEGKNTSEESNTTPEEEEKPAEKTEEASGEASSEEG